LSLNLSSTIYRKIPIQLFVSVGTYAKAKQFSPNSEVFLAEFGASVVLVRDVLEVHFPFLYSKDLKDALEADPNINNYSQQIRFTFNLNELKPRQRLQYLMK
jgi:hypothetical protein